MTEFTAYHVPSDGEQPIVKITRTEGFTLDEMQDVVGGYIEGLFKVPNPETNEYDGQWVMVINEEGYRIDLPTNRRITVLLRQLVVGDVLIMQNELFDKTTHLNMKGETWNTYQMMSDQT